MKGLFGISIESIDISGLKRMKEDAVLEVLPVRPGDTYTDADLARIRIALEKTGLFSRADVSVRTTEETTVVIEIFLEEKWTLIPIPFFYYANGGFGGGMFLLESNFLGRRQVLVSGITVNSREKFFLASFSDPDIGSSPFGVSGAFTMYDREAGPSSFSVTMRVPVSISEIFTFTPGIGFGAGTDSAFFRDSGEKSGFVPILSFPLRFYLDSSFPDGIFSRGAKALVSFSPGFYPGRPGSSHVIESYWQYAWLPVKDHQIEARIHAEYDILDPVFLKERGGRRGERTLPGNEVITGALAAVDLNYQAVFWSGDAFSAAVLFFAEAGMYAMERFLTFDGFVSGISRPSGRRFYSGGGTGMRLYLKKLAIPAMGLDIGYNVPADRVQFSFSLGMAM